MILKVPQLFATLFLFGLSIFLFFQFNLIFTSLCLFLFSLLSFFDLLISLIKFISRQKVVKPEKVAPLVKSPSRSTEPVTKSMPVKESTPKKPSYLKIILLQTFLAGILIPQFFVFPISFLFQYFSMAFILKVIKQPVATSSLMTVQQLIILPTYFLGMIAGTFLVRFIFQKREALENKNYVAKASAQLYFLFNLFSTLWRFLPSLTRGDLPRAIFLQFAVLPIILLPIIFYFISKLLLR